MSGIDGTDDRQDTDERDTDEQDTEGRPMTSADLTAHDPQHGQERGESSNQDHHDPETEEDTASGGAPD